MGLRYDPVGGGQFKQAVQSIIEAESKPVRALTAKKTKEETKLKLFQEFKSKFGGLDKALTELNGFRKFRELKVDLGDGEDLVSVTVDKDIAEPGKYELEIDSLAKKTSIISTGLDDPNSLQLGEGFIRVGLENGDTSEIYVDEKHSSLHGVAALINREEHATIQAAVIKDVTDPENPWKLIITAKKDGEANQLDTPDFYFLDGAAGFEIDDDQEAENAHITIDGFSVELESNDAKDFLPGVNLHLKQADSDRPFSMVITQDYQKISGKVKTAVDQINQVLQFIVGQNTLDEHSDTSVTFGGDTSLQNLEFAVRNKVHQGYGVITGNSDEAQVVYLNEVGIEFDKHGQLQFKEEKFTKALEGDFERISQAISGPNGFANQLKSLMSAYTQPGNGLLAAKEQTMRSRIKEIDTQIDSKNRMIEQKKQAVTDQFARLESTIGGMQKQQQYLSATLGGGGGGNIVSQLLGG